MPTFYGITFFLLELDLLESFSVGQKYQHISSQSLVKKYDIFESEIQKSAVLSLYYVALWHR